MLYVDTEKPVDIPNTVAKCPECNEVLWVEITEWDAETGEVTEGGFEITCDFEEFDKEIHAERWISDWHPVEAEVYQWLLDNVRVADVTPADLANWNEAVMDWAKLKA